MGIMMLPNEHINVMAWAATHFSDAPIFEYRASSGQWKGIHHGAGRNDLGQELVDANAAAIRARGGSTTGYTYSYSQPKHAHWSAVEGLKAIRCFEYQASEMPDWEQSDARAICAQLTTNLIGHLPGSDEAPWVIDEETEPTEPF